MVLSCTAIYKFVFLISSDDYMIIVQKSLNIFFLALVNVETTDAYFNQSVSFNVYNAPKNYSNLYFGDDNRYFCKSLIFLFI